MEKLIIEIDSRAESSLRVRTPEGGEIMFAASAELAEFVHRRLHVTWSHSVRMDDASMTDAKAHAQAAELLAFAQSAHMFSDRNGNCSWRSTLPQTLVVTPRQVEKAACLPEDLILVQHDPTNRVLRYSGPRKPSIDTSVQATLYAALPSIHGLLHVHRQAGIFLPKTTTSFPFPCGVQEEADVVLEALRRVNQSDTPFIVELVHHGFLIGLEEGGAQRLHRQWRGAVDAYRSHLTRIGKQDVMHLLQLQPIMAEARIIGVIATHPQEAWSSCYLLRAERGSGFGRRLLEPLAKRGLNVRAHVDCNVSRFYQVHGWTEIAQDAETVTLAPPCVSAPAR